MPDVIHRHVQENKLRHILFDEFEAAIAAQVRDVIHRAGHEVVYADDLVAARQQQINQVRAQEARGASDHGGGNEA